MLQLHTCGDTSYAAQQGQPQQWALAGMQRKAALSNWLKQKLRPWFRMHASQHSPTCITECRPSPGCPPDINLPWPAVNSAQAATAVAKVHI
jgi:hypothetical protein